MRSVAQGNLFSVLGQSLSCLQRDAMQGPSRMATAYPPADPRIANVLRNAAWVENAACPWSDVAAQFLFAWRHLTWV